MADPADAVTAAGRQSAVLRRPAEIVSQASGTHDAAVAVRGDSDATPPSAALPNRVGVPTRSTAAQEEPKPPTSTTRPLGGAGSCASVAPRVIEAPNNTASSRTSSSAVTMASGIRRRFGGAGSEFVGCVIGRQSSPEVLATSTREITAKIAQTMAPASFSHMMSIQRSSVLPSRTARPETTSNASQEPRNTDHGSL